MRTNIERAINDLILSNKEITLVNALPVYFREAGFEGMSPDALVAFEHALDKYPTHSDQSRAVFVKGVSGIRAEYWSNKSAILADVLCTHCDACARGLFTREAETKAQGCERPKEEKEKAAKRRLKSKKRGRRVRAKRDVVAVGLDPYAPSTSTVML